SCCSMWALNRYSSARWWRGDWRASRRTTMPLANDRRRSRVGVRRSRRPTIITPPAYAATSTPIARSRLGWASQPVMRASKKLWGCGTPRFSYLVEDRDEAEQCEKPDEREQRRCQPEQKQPCEDRVIELEVHRSEEHT